jgi:[ribosomal protein S18]-alanine N-acetyltransferase
MILRPATRADAAALAEVHAAAFDAPWLGDDILRFAEAPGGFAIAAEAETTIAGFILCRAMAGEAEILTLAVRPSRRRRGVARALVEAAAALVAQSVDTMFLEVAEDNSGAVALYESSGFSAVGRRGAYYARAGAPAVAAIIMRRALNS